MPLGGLFGVRPTSILHLEVYIDIVRGVSMGGFFETSQVTLVTRLVHWVVVDFICSNLQGCGSKKGTVMNLRNVFYPPVPCLCAFMGASDPDIMWRGRTNK